MLGSGGGGGGGCLEVSSLILGSELGTQSARQGQEAGPAAEGQAGVGQS